MALSDDGCFALAVRSAPCAGRAASALKRLCKAWTLIPAIEEDDARLGFSCPTIGAGLEARCAKV